MERKRETEKIEKGIQAQKGLRFGGSEQMVFWDEIFIRGSMNTINKQVGVVDSEEI